MIHDPDPLAACAELWREGIVNTRGGPASRHLVACAYEGNAVIHVFPGPGPTVCRRLGMEPLP